MTEEERQELQNILDQNNVKIPLDKFPPMQPPLEQRKRGNKCNNQRLMNETQYIETTDGAGVGALQYNTKGMTHGYSSSALRELPSFTPQHLGATVKPPVKFQHMNTLQKNHHYSTSSKLIAATTGTLIEGRDARTIKNAVGRKPNAKDKDPHIQARGDPRNKNSK